MRLAAGSLAGLLLLAWAPAARAECNYVILVKCFIAVLDEWAWTLYENQENVVTVDDKGCQHFNTISKCIADDHPDPTQVHYCSPSEIMEASRTVSDLLTHRKHSGTFLKSYYLLHYACTDGREAVKEHQKCLDTEAIGEQTLSAAGYLEEKFRENPMEDPEEACGLLTSKLTSFRAIIAQQNLCGGEAERLMCESLKRMFTHVEAGLLGNCQFDCSTPNGLPKISDEPQLEKVDSNGNAALKKPTGGAASPALALSTLLSLTFAALLL